MGLHGVNLGVASSHPPRRLYQRADANSPCQHWGAPCPWGGGVRRLHVCCFGGWFVVRKTQWTTSPMHCFVENWLLGSLIFLLLAEVMICWSQTGKAGPRVLLNNSASAEGGWGGSDTPSDPPPPEVIGQIFFGPSNNSGSPEGSPPPPSGPPHPPPTPPPLRKTLARPCRQPQARFCPFNFPKFCGGNYGVWTARVAPAPGLCCRAVLLLFG